jgi:hypothetical protein
LINVSETAVDISNWQLTDNVGTATLPGSTTLAADETIWLADEATSFARQFGYLPDYELTDTDPTVPQLSGSWPGFSNTGDEVVLLDNLANIVDVLIYEGSLGQTGWSGTAVNPYTVSSVFGADGQILYRMRD